MPSGRTHFVAGVISSSIVMYHMNGPPEMMMAGALGSLLPDIDHRHSLLGRYAFVWLICKHRGFTHSTAAWVLFTLVLFLTVDDYWAIGLSIGYASHIFLDCFGVTGVQLRWPHASRFTLRRRKRWR